MAASGFKKSHSVLASAFATRGRAVTTNDSKEKCVPYWQCLCFERVAFVHELTLLQQLSSRSSPASGVSGNGNVLVAASDTSTLRCITETKPASWRGALHQGITTAVTHHVMARVRAHMRMHKHAHGAMHAHVHASVPLIAHAQCLKPV